MLEHIRTRMSIYPRPWWIAGGWAIDLHLGQPQRPHKDVDIAVLRRDQAELQSCFSAWSLHKVVNGALEPWLTNETLQLPIHEVHAQHADEQLEFLFNEADGDTWLFRRNLCISMPLNCLSRCTSEGISYLCPEVVLLYKAKNPREHDIEDFERVRGMLNARAKRWLADALTICHPGHEWTSRL
jgi:hypothetical protein